MDIFQKVDHLLRRQNPVLSLQIQFDPAMTNLLLLLLLRHLTHQLLPQQPQLLRRFLLSPFLFAPALLYEFSRSPEVKRDKSGYYYTFPRTQDLQFPATGPEHVPGLLLRATQPSLYRQLPFFEYWVEQPQNGRYDYEEC